LLQKGEQKLKRKERTPMHKMLAKVVVGLEAPEKQCHHQNLIRKREKTGERRNLKIPASKGQQ